MKAPDLSRIVETDVPLSSLRLENLLTQLRSDILKPIRELQSAGQIEWFSFLVYQARQVTGRAANDETLVFHLRLEPSSDLSVDQLIAVLPDHFRNPHPVQLAEISGLNGALLNQSNWAEAWRIIGESSEWVLSLAALVSPNKSLQLTAFGGG
jgi:hypothetical protein